MEQGSYDEDYSAKYNNELIYNMVRQYAEHYVPMFKECGKKFLEIGAASDIVLDVAKEHGFQTTGLDINKQFKTDKHNFIYADIEKVDLAEKYDVIWMSHVVEHLKDPLKVMQSMYNSLNSGGILFVSMPDPWAMNHASLDMWLHFVVIEHHIMWDMDSFIDELEKIGFKYEYSYRNMKQWLCTGDYQIIVRKP
jgi:2-polyprenyl-3-methyl-5-hydroxy-6-metoxy-1,4-benzoquinol methylase